MEFNSHKLRLWLSCTVVVLLVYFLYNQIFKTPEIKYTSSSQITETSDVNQAEFGEQMGQVRDIGIGKLDKAVFTNLDPKTKEIVREWGFEKLLHEESQQWEIEKPFMNIYQPSFKCYVTADKGYIVVESETSPPNPTDAQLIGNVTAHIVPEPGSDLEESYIYLDDVIFISEKSLFSTDGPVSLVSKSADMKGRGLEVIYDDELDRMDLLRIIHVDSMNLKTKKALSLSQDKKPEPDKGRKTEGGEQMAEDRGRGTEDVSDKKYKVILSNNVVIETAEELIVANEVSISQLLFSDRRTKTENLGQKTEVEGQKTEQLKQRPEEFVDIKVTCEGGIVVLPADSARTLESITGSAYEKITVHRASDLIDKADEKTVFVADKIDYNAITADAVAPGLSKLRFFVKDALGKDDPETVVPITVVSRKQARFSPKTNQIIFEGDTVCHLPHLENDILQQYTLSTPKLIIDLHDTDGQESKIKKLTAQSEGRKLAKLESLKYEPRAASHEQRNLLSGIELKCARFEYDTTDELFLANGPGVIKVNNSNLPEATKQSGRFSLQKPCNALIKDFDILKYNLAAEQIIAESKDGRLSIGYEAVSEDQQGIVVVTASCIEADFVETTTGQYKLWSLSAKNGVSYKDENHYLEGDKLFYDEATSIITVNGSESNSAYYNGILFDNFEYNLTTDEVKEFQVKEPGMFISRR